MAKITCSEDKYSKDGRCCHRCHAGWYVQAACDGERQTQCAKCRNGFYTATNNHIEDCQPCTVCSSDNHYRKASDCTATKNTVCECETGFYCSNRQCEHCQRVTHCPVGQGVKVPATRTNDTICATCEKGTYSNVTDFLSPCRPHIRCDIIGRELKMQGTPKNDTVCGNLLPRCSWLLPAGLWSGLVLTSLVFFAVVICWKAKRKSYRAATSKVPITLVDVVPSTMITCLDLPLPSTELMCHCQESFKLPHFHPEEDEDHLHSCDVDSSLPITPWNTSVPFAESNPKTGDAGYCTGNFRRTYSEPQEDEWCGTS